MENINSLQQQLIDIFKVCLKTDNIGRIYASDILDIILNRRENANINTNTTKNKKKS